MKKIISIFLMTLFTAGIFASSNNESASEAANAEPVELSMHFMGSYPQMDQQRVYDEFNRILLERHNMTIDFKPAGWGEYDNRMQMMISSGEEFDLCYTAGWINNYSQNVAKGAFIPLDDLLPKYAPTLYSRVPKAGWDAVRIDGSIYGSINLQIATKTNAVAFPKHLVEKYGFDTTKVKTLEDLEPYLKAVKEGEEGIIPLGAFNEPGTLLGYVKEYLGFELVVGGAVPGAVAKGGTDTTVFNQYATKEFREWIELMHYYYEKGYIKEDALAITDINPNLSSGGVGVSFMGNYAPGSEIDTAQRWGYDVEIQTITKPYMMTSNYRGTLYGVSTTSEHPIESVKFLEILNTDKELYNLLSFGMEGVDYDKGEGEYIAPIENSGYAPNTIWAFGETFNAYLLPGQPEDVWDQMRAMNDNADVSPLMGFSFDPASVQSEMAQCTSVRQEYLPALELGIVDPAEYMPIFLDKLETAGAQVIIDEAQRQIDEWLKTK